MRRSIVLLSILAALVIPSLAFGYTASDNQSSSSDGWASTHTFTGLPAASGDITVSIYLQGDYYTGGGSPDSSENTAISIEGVSQGTFSPTASFNSNANCRDGTFTFTIAASAADDGVITVVADNSSQMGYSACDPHIHNVTISYSTNTAPSISNVGNQSTNEDTSDSVSFTVSDAEDSNGSLSVSATSSNQSVIANGDLSISGSGGNRTLSMTPVGNASGATTITLTVTDSGGMTDTDTFTWTINPVNDPPVADAGGPYNGDEGSPTNLDGSGSSDIDDAIALFEWDCDNDSTFDVSGSAASCTFDDDGTYTIGLRVTDTFGAQSGTDTATVNVGNLAPSVSITGSTNGSEGSSMALGSSANDPSSVDQAALSYVWTITDGNGAQFFTGSGPGVIFPPNDDGAWQASLTVTDPQGATATDTVTLTIANVAPTILVGGPTSGTEGSPLTHAGLVSDPSSVDIANLSRSWSVTDAAGSVVATGSGTTLGWTPGDDGVYTVTGTVTDPQGATGTDSLTVTVAGVAPTVAASGPSTGDEGSSLSYSAVGSDASATDQASLTYAWLVTDAGGTVTTGTGSSFSFTPDDDGAYTVAVTVTDPGGLTGTDSISVTVSNVAPSVTATGDTTGSEGSSASYSATGTDPSSVDQAALTYAWTATTSGGSTVATGSNPSFSFTPDDDDTYTVAVLVTDPQGATGADSVTTVISGVAPTASASGPATGDEGSSLSYSATGTDPSTVDQAALTFAWAVTDAAGSSVATAAGASLSWTPADDGAYTVTVTATDPGGLTGTDSIGLTVSNVAPTVTASGDTTGTEGTAANFSAVGADVGTVDNLALAYVWNATDAAGTSVASDTGTSFSFTPDDDGTYTATVTVTDPQGATVTDSVTLVVSNAAPTASASGPATGDEGSQITFTATGTDASGVDQAALTFAWDVTDAAGTSVGTGTGASLAWTPTDDGTYTATVTATDPQGATGTDNATITVSNVAPSMTSLTGPATGDEGSLLSFTASANDVGTGDLPDLVLTWDWGDGTATETGTALDHTYADDGTYTITVTVDDQDGGTDSDTLVVTVANIAPIIDSTPGTSAPEGVLYTYQPTVVDPGDEVFGWSLAASAPAAMTIDASTGLIEWTPDYADALVGSFAVTLTVDDGDGDTDAQSWTIVVDVADADADGLPDGWELANGLDPTDPNDATADPDADGLTNADELAEGQDPNVYDGPGAPTLVDPIGGSEVATDTPDLLWDDAVDPQGEALTYDVEVYSDSALTTLVASVTGVIEDGSGQSAWKVDQVLAENAEHWWRVRANDAWVAGPWTTEDSFVVNALNEAPGVPVLTVPIGGQTAASASPTLQWSEASDIDEDALTYDLEVWDADGNLVTDATGVAGDGVSGEWVVDVTLTEDAFYSWTARAVDEHGLAGDWAAEEDFFVSTENAAPSDPVFIAPVDGDTISELSPLLEATEAIDPEGGLVDYQFEVDTVASFDSADYATATVGEPLWDLAEDGITLPEDGVAYARVRAIDEAGISSATDTISFFVSATNDPPTVPVLSAPADGEEVSATPTLVVEDPTDPEGDVLFIEFAIATDEALVELVVGINGIVVEGTGTTSWTVPSNLEGAHWWTARAIDSEGNVSDWAAPWQFVAPAGESEVPPPPPEETGCDCQNSVASGKATLLWLLLLPVVALRRRRS